MTTETAILGGLKIIITLTAVILVIIALAKPAWLVTSHYTGSSQKEGLFRRCFNPYDPRRDELYYGRSAGNSDLNEDNNCATLTPVTPRLKAVRAFMIMGCIALIIVLTLAILMIAKMPIPAVAMASLFCFASICIMIACAIYTATYRHANAGFFYFGYAFWCAWVAFIIAVLATPMMSLVKSAYNAIS